MGTTLEAGVTMAPIVRQLVMSRAAYELIAGLAQETRQSKGDVLRLAIGMYGHAVDARKQAKHVGIADSPEGLDVEFTDFWGG